MAYKIVIANQKGGVAKTTTAVNIADALMFMKYRVLLIDLDPQSNSTAVFLGDEKSDKSVLDVILEKDRIKNCIEKSDFGDIVPASKELANWDGQLISTPGGTKRIKKSLKDIEDDYDFIIMDTSPSLGGAMRNALFAADGIIIPVQAKKFALDGLSDFLDTVFALKDDGNENLQILGILLTMLDQRNKQDREVLMALPDIGESLGINVFKHPIRICQDIENAIADAQSLFRTKGSSNGANDYADLVLEILDIIGGKSKKKRGGKK